MLEQRVALPQTQLAGADVQDPAPVDASRPVKHGAGGGVVAGVQPQDPHGHASGAVSVLAAAFSGCHLEFVEKRAYDLNLNYFHKDGKLYVDCRRTLGLFLVFMP